ncbi:hypothetical protein H1J40_05855 [Mycobacterium canettii]|uniref:hypothetical protein n=1 Tax=Mycobacterium canetti TaxID=78331 RepID=UPI0015EB4F7B|nr:hypothetical protein [Mycobacterium canetti]MBA2785700.1 hypothetical protein [Mycobacterium canetti]
MTDTNTETTTVDKADDTEDTASDTEQVTDDPGDHEQPDTFPRSYVEELRQENGRYRQRAQQADQYAQRLHTELVRATGRLADPTDLPFDAEHLDDADKMAAAIDDLLARKPHLVNRRPVGDIGQGATSSGAGTVDLAAILRQRAQ